jgi:outer membrane murein-binding lipoprotein Lpp
LNHTVIHTFLLSTLLLFLAGCSSSQLYSSKADIEKINTKIETLEQSIQSMQTDNVKTQQESFELFFVQHKELVASLQTQLSELQADQNTSQKLLQELVSKNKPKKVIVYKNKNEGSKIDGKLLLGQEENVSIQPPGITLRARIDTGADTSSLDARDTEEFERDGKKWVKFTLIDRKSETPHVVEAEISRYVKIVQSSLPDGYDKRIVVKLKLNIGDFSDLSEFTLSSREHMEFPVLIGRNVLKDIAIVDVSGKNLAPLKKKE